MLKIAVCDDEPEICEYLRTQVLDFFAAEDIDGSVSIFNDGLPLVKTYEDGTADFDMILLDITMKQCDGLSAAKKIREYNCDVMIVFVTASAEYVFSGYEVRAFRYILKPELLHGFRRVFSECVAELTKKDESVFSFQTGADTVSIPLREILYFESDRRKISIVCPNDREYTFYGKLDNIENQLKKLDFVRCHQSFLVNTKKILSLRGTELALVNETVIPVSKRRAKETSEAFLWAMR
ncbi:MAG: response regulator transcription factor [Clostridia bacterium]|nr:response regulator transcription factor [Clostridia bacterium]MBR3975070.1 response regulator transcription factor [Clostridia bacterium]